MQITSFIFSKAILMTQENLPQRVQCRPELEAFATRRPRRRIPCLASNEDSYQKATEACWNQASNQHCRPHFCDAICARDSLSDFCAETFSKAPVCFVLFCEDFFSRLPITECWTECHWNSFIYSDKINVRSWDRSSGLRREIQGFVFEAIAPPAAEGFSSW